MQWFIDNVWLVPFYPLLAFVLIVLGRGTRLMPVKEMAMALTVGGTAVGLAHAVSALFWLLSGPTPAPIEMNWSWLQAGPLNLSVGYLLDSMSVMMLFVVTFISLLIQIYTHGYMGKDPGYAKFYGYLALFNFSMLGLVLSTNLFQMYIFWELVGVSSYLLIGFWFTRPSAGQAAVKAFLMNRVGDFGFLLGILSFLFFGFAWWQAQPDTVLLSFSAMEAAAPVVREAVGPGLFAIIALLIFMGPMAKSAQLPLHTWLPDAMEGPTPISALIHAATMVAAGVYLVGRVYPIFQQSEIAMSVVATIGTLTALVAATIALTQTDIKKALAYSTVSQLGFMIAAMGVGAYTAGLFHLFTHAFFKAMLFLCSGSVIHALHDEQDMRHMGGLMKYLPVTGATYLIGTLSISGFLLSGFWSKDEVLIGAIDHPLIFGVLSFTAGLTAFYMFRSFFMTFTGKYRGHHEPHHEDPVMTMPLVVLAVPSIGIGYLLSGYMSGVPAFGDYIHAAHTSHSALQEAIHHGPHILGLNSVAVASLLIGVAGAVVAYLFYGPKPVLSADWFRRQFPSLYQLFTHKWYFDDLYSAFVNRVYLKFARLTAAFDRAGLDGLVNLTANTVVVSGFGLKALQSGRIQAYIAVMFFAVVVLSLLFVYQLM
jgi:NAD(P)H-quinone oxidoreductase subunit 5